MAIQMRRGEYDDFDASNMLAGELAVVVSGDPETEGGALYVATAAGSATRVAFANEIPGDATTTSDGLMSAADKAKLDGVAAGAQANVIESISVNGTAVDVNNKNAAISIPQASSDSAGLMAASDKTKLNGIEAGANAYSLPAATTAMIGGVKPDGTTVTVDGDGTIHAAGSGTIPDGSITGVKIADNTIPDAKLAQTGGILESLQAFKDGTFDYATIVSENLLNINDPDVVHGSYMTNDGRVFTAASYGISGYIAVEEGESYTLQTSAGTITNRATRSIRFLTAYDADKNIVTSAGGENINPYVVPSGIAYIRLSVADAYLTSDTWPSFVKGTTLLPYIEYFPPYVKYTLKASAANDEHTRSILTEYIPSGLRHKFNINNEWWNGTVDIQDLAEYTLTFRGTISEFLHIAIGRGYGQNLGGYVVVTQTQVRAYVGDATNVLTVDHNLTINDYLCIVLKASRNNTATVSVYTNGGSYTSSSFSWDVRKGALTAGSSNAVMTDCELTYWCNGYASDTQVYGDSYISPAHTDRWPSYLIAAGYNDFLLNAYSGRGSATALASLKQVLQSSDPRRIVWTLGMNDGDDEGATDAVWKSCVEEVMAICQERGIELILATIPNVPSVDNTAKNAYVRASGYRYIDFANAVGAVSDTAWYNGMLSDDNVHPTVQGAIALFTQAISDVPELMK